ncbi:hypothetical protein [Arthrobacter sp. StoSoilB22]|uniref:hypothetical protein n=1 Tax=Arthrobacter sp. StoSoilB22 TaxID=2830996 RepID=UPI001CC50779|nr:hypothetical protein [Arthrobacter sp. StoSoilB22]BCW61832.1 hypothetical protein StoSoilB22_08050 [Arthrobacter sp. StoSoilB22]
MTPTVPGLDPAALKALAELGTPILWLMAVAFFAPPVIAVIQQTRWSARKQSIVAFLFYVAVAGVWVWLNGLFSVVGWIAAVLLVFIVAGTAYREAWKKLGVTGAIQSATDVDKTDGPDHRAEPGG